MTMTVTMNVTMAVIMTVTMIDVGVGGCDLGMVANMDLIVSGK